MKKFIPILLTLGLGFSFTSCEDALDVTPNDRLDMTTYFTKATDLELYSNPYYNNILPKQPFNQQSDQLVERTLSDLMMGGKKRFVPQSDSYWDKDKCWKDLRRINTLLDNADRCSDKAAVVKYTAVSRFFRAYLYFQLVRRYGDVPWYEYELGSADPELYKPRDTREFVMQKMLEDVEYAIEHLPAKKDEKDSPFRATKGAALALKAQFCLYEGTWRKYHGVSFDEHDYKYYLAEAANAAKTLMDRNEYSIKRLTGNPDTDYRDLFVQEVADADEYILAICASAEPALAGSRHNANAYTLKPTQGRPGITRKFICSYLMKDGTRFTDRPGWQTMQFADEMKNRDPRLSQTVRGLNYTRIGQNTVLAPDLMMTATGYQPIKFVQAKNSPGSSNDNDAIGSSTNDMPVFRYAEVLLILAEAKAELGTLTQADLDATINVLRDRVGMPHLILSQANANPDPYLTSAETGYPNVTGSNAGVILEIRRERGIEMVMEGVRIDDLFRWKAGKCLDQAISGLYFPCPGNYDLTGDGKADIGIYEAGQGKPTGVAATYQINSDIFLSEGNRGYFDWHKGMKSERYGFNEARDYLYPIPSDQISVNGALKQNPGW